MAEPSLLCVNCTQPPPAHRRTWDRCVRCAELKLPATYYCSPACQESHWPKHRQWHKAQKERAEEFRKGTADDHDRSLAEKAARDAERTGNEYDKRCASAMALHVEGDYHAEAKVWRKMIKEWPDLPAPCHNLAVLMQRSSRLVEAAPMFLKAMELSDLGTKNWAQAAAGTFEMLRNPDCVEMSKPEWWNDEGLKALSAQVVAVAPEAVAACGMRAFVLCGSLGKAPWNVGPRAAAEIKEAATWYRRAAMVSSIRADKLRSEDLARKCDDLADPLLAEEEAEAAAARVAAEVEAAKARAAAEVEAEAARKVAEAKATAAAEELLAEEEKEKQKGGSTKPGKTKQGKGKKGKGTR